MNRGFLREPILPIYASGAMLILFVTIPLQGNPVAIYIAGMIAATALDLKEMLENKSTSFRNINEI